MRRKVQFSEHATFVNRDVVHHIMKNLSKISVLALIPLIGCNTHYSSDKPTDLKKPKFDTDLLYGVWDSEEGGNADLKITKDEFYLVEFFESSDYEVEGNTVKISGSTFYNNGEFLKVSEDSLKIKWIELDQVVTYWKFKN